VITDPHLKVDVLYPVFNQTLALDQTWDGDGKFVSLLVRDDNGRFIGYSWPDKSVWVDYFNDCACRYWAELYSY
jgi:alpha-glucosidase (family GH31 glycosyl hydrolase)